MKKIHTNKVSVRSYEAKAEECCKKHTLTVIQGSNPSSIISSLSDLGQTILMSTF